MDCANVQSSSNIMALHLLWQSFKQWRQQHENDGLEEKVTFLSDDDLASIKEKTHKRKINTLRFWTIINLLILGLSIFTTCLRFLPGKPHIRDSAVRETSYYCKPFQSCHQSHIELTFDSSHSQRHGCQA